MSKETKEVKPNKQYRSSDMFFSSYLISIGYPLVTTEETKTPEGAKKVVFVFSMPEAEVIKTRALYFGGSGTVKVREFVDNIRSLKSLIHTVLIISLCLIH